MKRALSILLAALLVMCALPAVAEEEGLLEGRYTSETDKEFMYLSPEGTGVLMMLQDDMLHPYGVAWTGDSLMIERAEISFTMEDDVLSFSYAL